MSLQGLFIRLGNPILAALLRSPLHATVDGGMMLISVTGRRSGKVHTTPVNYLRDGETLTIVSLQERTWWRNLRGGAEVGVHLQGKARRGHAAVVEDDASVATALGRILGRDPAYARFLGVRTRPDGTAEPEDLARASRSRVVVSIQLMRA
jgi:deazaflavin-dependent oxidoreductase (nitroreductase family)